MRRAPQRHAAHDCATESDAGASVAAAMAAITPSPLDTDECDALGLSTLELEEEEDLTVRVGDLAFTLAGYARDAGQTLACTGETTWRGGDILSRHLWDARPAADAIVEVGAGPLPEWRRCLPVPALSSSRRRHQHAGAAKSSRNSSLLAELGRRPQVWGSSRSPRRRWSWLPS